MLLINIELKKKELAFGYTVVAHFLAVCAFGSPCVYDHVLSGSF
jgi:hypothetical protein